MFVIVTGHNEGIRFSVAKNVVHVFAFISRKIQTAIKYKSSRGKRFFSIPAHRSSVGAVAMNAKNNTTKVQTCRQLLSRSNKRNDAVSRCARNCDTTGHFTNIHIVDIAKMMFAMI